MGNDKRQQHTEPRIINPYRLFVGSFIPNWVLRCPDLSHGAKLAYARLCQYADKDTGEAWPGQEAWAEEIGVSARTLRRYIEELEEFKLIQVVQRGQSETNFYRFLDHPLMSGLDRSKVTTPDRSELSTQDRSKVTTPLLSESVEKNHRKESEDALPFGHAFRPVWESWLRYRKERKQALTPSTIKAQLEKLSTFSESEAIAIIQTSIEQGWQGLFPERLQRNKADCARAPARYLMTADDIARESANLR